jgi:hypothetical protein
VQPGAGDQAAAGPHLKAQSGIEIMPMIRSPFWQRLIGLLLVGVGVGFSIETWHTARTEGHYLRLAIIFPAFAVFGLMPLCFPLTNEEMPARWDTEKPTFGELPLRYKLVTVLAVAASIVYWILLESLLG